MVLLAWVPVPSLHMHHSMRHFLRASLNTAVTRVTLTRWAGGDKRGELLEPVPCSNARVCQKHHASKVEGLEGQQ